MRIAFVCPPPSDSGGLPARALNTILGLSAAGVTVEVFTERTGTAAVDALDDAGIPVRYFTSKWRFDRWYSSGATSKLVTGTLSRIFTQRRLAAALVDRHAEAPFDLVYRLSQIELLSLRSRLSVLPPVVVHPGTHAFGELRWHWRERALARRGESAAYFASSHAYLGYRSLMQWRDIRLAAALITPSRRFAAHVSRDYRIPPGRFSIVPNPIDLDTFRPAKVSPERSPVRILFVSRMSMRKGVELVVSLSHRLDDLAGRVEISCVGGASLFSDYRTLLSTLNPRTAAYCGELPAEDLRRLYQASHGLLQPSRYEPFANTVAEGLACGLPVLVSDEVGAGEFVDPRVCRVHPSGNVDALEAHVRTFVAEVEQGHLPPIRELARAEAGRQFAPSAVSSQLARVLDSIVVSTGGGTADRT